MVVEKISNRYFINQSSTLTIINTMCVKFTLDHPKEAVGMLKKHQPQLDEEVAVKEIDILRTLTNAKDLKVLGSMTKEKMEQTQDLMVKYMDLKSPVNIAEVFTNEFLA